MEGDHLSKAINLYYEVDNQSIPKIIPKLDICNTMRSTKSRRSLMYILAHLHIYPMVIGLPTGVDISRGVIKTSKVSLSLVTKLCTTKECETPISNKFVVGYKLT